MRFAIFHRITRSARASTFGGTTSILDFGLRILDCTRNPKPVNPLVFFFLLTANRSLLTVI
jgi:hypothetical protein